MIVIWFKIIPGNAAGMNDGNVDDHITGAHHESRGLCVLKISNVSGVRLPPGMHDNTVIERVQLTEKGCNENLPIGRVKQGDAEVNVSMVKGDKRDVTISGKSFADVIAAWDCLLKGTLKPQPVTFR